MISLNDQDRRTLAYLESRAKAWLFGFKRHRKYSARANSGFTEREMEQVRAITTLQESTRTLLEGPG